MLRNKDIPEEVSEALKEQIRYDPLSGKFFWNNPGLGRRRNGQAGSMRKDKYCTIFLKVNGVEWNIPAHRAAWFLSYGYWPEYFIDHINQKKDDNRLVNLREATPSQNLMNKGKYLTDTQTNRRTITHGVYVGVDQMKSGRWRAICARKYLGTYDTPEEAALAYNKEAKERFGKYAHQNVVD